MPCDQKLIRAIYEMALHYGEAQYELGRAVHQDDHGDWLRKLRVKSRRQAALNRLVGAAYARAPSDHSGVSPS